MLGLLVATLLIRYGLGTTGCYDRGSSCTLNTCTKFPEFAKNNCAKTCGFCDPPVTEKASSCYDKNLDCTADTCQNFPYTAKERCAKTCGHCTTERATSSHSSHTSLSSSSSSSKFVESSRRHNSMSEIHKTNEFSPDSSRRRGSDSALCYDKDMNCKKETCQEYPYTAKERCAKTCGFCDTVKRTGKHQAHTHDRSSPESGTLARKSSIQGIYGDGGKPSNVDDLIRDRDIKCMDLDSDCAQKTCRDYPYTAKNRCKKTCGFCRQDEIQRTTITTAPPKQAPLPGGSATAEPCFDRVQDCSPGSCLDFPNTARRNCAKTCGFCGSTISVNTASGDIKRGLGEEITLETDKDDGRPSSRGSSQSSSRTSSISSSVSSKRSFKSKGKIHEFDERSSSRSSITSDITATIPGTSKQDTTPLPYGKGIMKMRYPGRHGPCKDENLHCDRGDCNKYPRFAQRYCEKTCDYC